MDQFYKDLVEKIREAAEKDIQKIMGSFVNFTLLKIFVQSYF